ncbi:hypothetical protein CPB85DRAFT_1434001 [Mucidula mucida]|nr:hypothetical protein CPB85DRAFT_1434001 [Mucidula mucida]
MPEPIALHRQSTRDLLDALTWRVTNKSYKSIGDLDLLDSRLQKLTAIARGKRNALIPVNQLPAELMVIIFTYSQQHLASFLPTPPNGIAYDKHHRDWLSLLHVCRHWRGIAATSNLLWTTIDNGLVPQKFLRRSGNAPLTVYCGVRMRSCPKSDLSLFLPHLHRIRELHMDISSWVLSIQDLYTAISKPAPLLESLTLDTMGPVTAPNAHLPAIFNGVMPRLRKLCLEYFTYWPTGYFRGLTSLCLHHMPFPESLRPTTAQFLDFLESSPDLEELILVSAGPTRVDAEDVPAPHTERLVALNKLRELTFGKIIDLSCVRRLLSYLSLPENAHMYFWGCPALGANDGDIANLIPTNLTHLPCMLGMEEWRIRCAPYHTFPTGRDNYIVAFVDKVLYTLDIGLEAHIARMAPVYAPVLRNVRKLYVNDTLDISTALWQDLFCCVPQLQELIIRPHLLWNASRGILAALYPEPVTQDKAPIRTGLKSMLRLDDILCPELKKLSFEVASTVQGPGFYISTFINERKVRGKPLDELELRYLRTPPPADIVYSPPSTTPPAQTPFPLAPQPPPPPPPVIIPNAQEQTSLEMESMRVASASVREVVYMHDQEPIVLEPKDWPIRGYIWTTMTLPEDE